MLNCTNFCTA